MTDENQTPPPTTSKGSTWGRLGIFFSLIGVIILVAGFIYVYFAITKLHTTFTKTVVQMQDSSSSHTADFSALQQNVTDLQAAVQKNEAQQEQTLADWRSAQKGDLDKWHAAEAQYLVKLANDQLQFSYNIEMAIAMLSRAEQTLQAPQDPNLLAVRKAIASDIARLQALPKVDVTQIYVNLSAINNQVEQLALPASPLSQPAEKIEPAPVDQSWWRTGLDRSWQALRKIVIVRYNGSNALPLILPEEKIFLYQNLHAQLEQAMWAVLNHNEPVYQAALTRANDWVKKYFVQNETAQAMLTQLQTLQTTRIKPADVNLAETLALFDQPQPAPDTAT